MSFHAGDLRGLVVERIESVHVTDQGLRRRQHDGEPQAHAQHCAGDFRMTAFEHITRADAGNDKCHRQVGRDHHVAETIGKARVEDDGDPVERIRHAVGHFEAGRSVHPAICRENPERRHGGAEGDGNGRCEMQGTWCPVPCEQHDAEEGGFQEKSPYHLIANHRPDDVAEDAREAAPVGPELIRHHQPGHDAHRDGMAKILVQKRASRSSARVLSKATSLRAWQ